MKTFSKLKTTLINVAVPVSLFVFGVAVWVGVTWLAVLLKGAE